MTRIVAEFHMTYNSGDDIKDVLKKLKTYKTLDSCPGKPYKWNSTKKLLYSIGADYSIQILVKQ